MPTGVEAGLPGTGNVVSVGCGKTGIVTVPKVGSTITVGAVGIAPTVNSPTEVVPSSMTISYTEVTTVSTATIAVTTGF